MFVYESMDESRELVLLVRVLVVLEVTTNSVVLKQQTLNKKKTKQKQNKIIRGALFSCACVNASMALASAITACRLSGGASG